MAIVSQYITDDQLQALLKPLNLDSMSDDEQQELVDRAVGDLEADLVKRFQVPLVAGSGGDFSLAAPYSRNKILNAMKSKIKQLIGQDHNRNVVVQSTERYIDTAKLAYKDHMDVLLDPMRVFDFKQLPYTQDSIEPVQSVALARADNATRVKVPGDFWD